MYTERVDFYISEKKSCLEIQIGWEPGYLTHLLGCVSESKNQGLSEYAYRKGCYKCQICVNEPKR